MSIKKVIIVLLSLCTILTPKHVFHGKSFQILIVWNLGYSNYITSVSPTECIHIDPGGTLKFPFKTIESLCALKKNKSLQLHKDRYHNSYLKFLRRWGAEDVEAATLTNEVTYFYEQQLLSFGHLNKEQIENVFLDHDLLFNSKYLILPNHGQPQNLTSEILKSFSNYKMVITGSQSRSYLHHNKTDTKFLKENQRPLIHKTVWGHLIFQKLN